MKSIDTYVISDLHLGHKSIAKFRTQFNSAEQHDEHIMDMWASTIRERDKVWVLGDAAFTLEGLVKLISLPGTKYLVRGNHDILPLRHYLVAFKDVFGFVKYKRPKRQKVWLSHAPIHPAELRGAINIHGHVHDRPILYPPRGPLDERYISVCPESIGYAPVLLHPLIPKKGEN